MPTFAPPQVPLFTPVQEQQHFIPSQLAQPSNDYEEFDTMQGFDYGDENNSEESEFDFTESSQ